MTVDLYAVVFLALWTFAVIYVGPAGKMRAAGVRWGFSNRETEPGDLPAWIGRADRAARNHFENLPMFAILVLVAHVSGKHDDVTAVASVVYCVARVFHALLYWTGVQYARTVAYYVGNACLVVIVSRLF